MIGKGIILIIWFVVGLYATTKGTRFTLLLVPVFATAFGVFAGEIYIILNEVVKKQKQIIKLSVKITTLILIAILLIQPIHAADNTAKNEVPSMNDAWHNTLTKIKTESQPDAIINSWWDFGHWFITISDRKATFDGAGQDRHMAHWIGKSLMSNNEKKTTGILRMVDCGNNDAFYKLNKITNNTIQSINLLNEIIVVNESKAEEILESEGLNENEATSVLKYTHCQAPEDYYIVSGDMIGKAGV
jgi:asparagine N-glycosylation enzyme membrane subunit Stt3